MILGPGGGRRGDGNAVVYSDKKGKIEPGTGGGGTDGAGAKAEGKGTVWPHSLLGTGKKKPVKHAIEN